MLTIQYLRENAQQAKDNATYRGMPQASQTIDDALALDLEIRKLQAQSQELRRSRNTLSEAINKAKKEKQDATAYLEEAKALPQKINDLEQQISKEQEKLLEMLTAIPNIASDKVPQGASEKDNVVLKQMGEKRDFDFEVINHAELAEALNIAEFDSAARVAGKGFFYLKNELALLNQALIQYAIQHIVKKGYTFIEPPLMIKKEVLAGVYSQIDIDQQSYMIDGENLALIATSEHPLIGMFTGQHIEHKQLPIKLVGYSQCFRKEIGSHGLDEKGLFRTHQFNKVELVIICKPEDSWQYFDELLNITCDIFTALELPYQQLEMCTGDLGLMKARQIDVEAFSPRRNDYFEVGSCSNLTDNQAALLQIRVQDPKGNYIPHTLNNTAIATSRTMVAILENMQEKDGSVRIPTVLVPYMGGLTHIKAK